MAPDVSTLVRDSRGLPKGPDRPQLHEFEPTEFHRVFSDAIPPALRIFPGDRVKTWTVDAGGVDRNGVRRSQGGNPETDRSMSKARCRATRSWSS